MGDTIRFLELRAQGRTNCPEYRRAWKRVQLLLEDQAAKPAINQCVEFSGEPRATFLVDFSPNKRLVASTHGDHTVRVSEVQSGKCIHVLTGHPRTPWCLAFNPVSDDILASGCLGGEVHIWDLRGGGSEVLKNPNENQVITSLAFTPSGDAVVFATLNIIYFWAWTGSKPFAFTQTKHAFERVRWLRFDPFGRYLYTGIANISKAQRNTAGPSANHENDSGSATVSSSNAADTAEPDRATSTSGNNRYNQAFRRLIDLRNARDQQGSGLSFLDVSRPRSPANDDNLSLARQYAQYMTAITSGPSAVHQNSDRLLRSRGGAGGSGSSGSDMYRDHAGDTLPSSSSQRRVGFYSGTAASYSGSHDMSSSASAAHNVAPFGLGRERRSRWGRYRPAFFSLSTEESVNRPRAAHSNNNGDEDDDISDDGNNNIVDWRLRRASYLSQDRPSPRAMNLTGRGTAQNSPTPPSGRFNPLHRPSVRSEVSFQNNLGEDEFEILPVDQGRGRRDTINSEASTSRDFINQATSDRIGVGNILEDESSDVGYRWDELRSLWVRCSNRSPSASPQPQSLRSDRDEAGPSSSARLSAQERPIQPLLRDIDPFMGHAESSVEVLSLTQDKSNSGRSTSEVKLNLPSQGDHEIESNNRPGPSGISRKSTATEPILPSRTKAGKGDSCRGPRSKNRKKSNLLAQRNALREKLLQVHREVHAEPCDTNTLALLRALESDGCEKSSSVPVNEVADVPSRQESETTVERHCASSFLCGNDVVDLSTCTQTQQANGAELNTPTEDQALNSPVTSIVPGHSRQMSSDNANCTSPNEMQSCIPRDGERASHEGVKSPPHPPEDQSEDLSSFTIPPSLSVRLGMKRKLAKPLELAEVCAGCPASKKNSLTSDRAEHRDDTSASTSNNQTCDSQDAPRSDESLGFSLPSSNEEMLKEKAASKNEAYASSSTASLSECQEPIDLTTQRSPSSDTSTTCISGHNTARDACISQGLAHNSTEPLAVSGQDLTSSLSQPVSSHDVTVTLSQALAAVHCSHFRRHQQGPKDYTSNAVRPLTSTSSSPSSMSRPLTARSSIAGKTAARTLTTSQASTTVTTSSSKTHGVFPGLTTTKVSPKQPTSTAINRQGLSAEQTSTNAQSSSTQHNIFPQVIPTDHTSTRSQAISTENPSPDIPALATEETSTNTQETSLEDVATPAQLLGSQSLTSSGQSSAFSIFGRQAPSSGSEWSPGMRGTSASVLSAATTLQSLSYPRLNTTSAISSALPSARETEPDSLAPAPPMGSWRLEQGRLQQTIQGMRNIASEVDREFGSLSSRMRDFASEIDREHDNLSRRVSELDRRISNLEQNYHRRMRHLYNEYMLHLFQYRRRLGLMRLDNLQRRSVLLRGARSRLAGSYLPNPGTPTSLSRPHRARGAGDGSRASGPHNIATRDLSTSRTSSLRSPEVGHQPARNRHGGVSSPRWLSLWGPDDYHRRLQRSGGLSTSSFSGSARRSGDNYSVISRMGINQRPISQNLSVAGDADSDDNDDEDPNEDERELTRHQIPLQRARLLTSGMSGASSSTSSGSAADGGRGVGAGAGSGSLAGGGDGPGVAEDDGQQDLELGHLHPDYRPSIFDDSFGGHDDPMQNIMNDTIAVAFRSRDAQALASNFVPQTYRIQQWSIMTDMVPDISNSMSNIVVRFCKLHNDASCSLSRDGKLLAAFVPTHRGFPDKMVLGVFSLEASTFAQCLYTKSFGPNAISVSISPESSYLLVGLAAKRLFFFSANQMVGQVYKLVRQKAGESSMRHTTDLYFPENRNNHCSVNSASWLPASGLGLVFGTNKGDLVFSRPGPKKRVELEEDPPHLRFPRRYMSRPPMQANPGGEGGAPMLILPQHFFMRHGHAGSNNPSNPTAGNSASPSGSIFNRGASTSSSSRSIFNLGNTSGSSSNASRGANGSGSNSNLVNRGVGGSGVGTSGRWSRRDSSVSSIRNLARGGWRNSDMQTSTASEDIPSRAATQTRDGEETED